VLGIIAASFIVRFKVIVLFGMATRKEVLVGRYIMEKDERLVICKIQVADERACTLFGRA